MVKQKFWRLEIEIVFWAVFDVMALGPVLLMHRKNFKLGPAQPPNEDSEVSDPSEHSPESAGV